MLCHLPYAEVPISSAEDFSRSYEITIGMAERGTRDKCQVFACVGPYPVLLLGLVEDMVYRGRWRS